VRIKGAKIMKISMVDVGEKEVIPRLAIAEGKIALKPGTVAAVRAGKTKKGDVLAVAETAGILAVKKTPELIPLCHQIPIDKVDFEFDFEKSAIACRCAVRARAKTGVEMEALCGAATALLNIWDMVKYLEKDENGQYPSAQIENIKVLEKRKG
jgi:cyclic pyranopterin phosphate synthase